MAFNPIDTLSYDESDYLCEGQGFMVFDDYGDPKKVNLVQVYATKEEALREAKKTVGTLIKRHSSVFKYEKEASQALIKAWNELEEQDYTILKDVLSWYDDQVLVKIMQLYKVVRPEEEEKDD